MRTREDILADLLAEVLDDPATLDPAVRRAAAANAGAPAPIAALVDTIHGGAYRVTDADIASARRTGLSEDQVFEAVVAASLGAAKKRMDAALAALEAASTPVKAGQGGSR